MGDQNVRAGQVKRQPGVESDDSHRLGGWRWPGLDWAGFWGDLLVGLLVPIVATFLALIWKALARRGNSKPSDEWLAVFELLLAATVLAVNEVFTSSEPSSSGSSTLVIAFVAVLFLFPIMGVMAWAIREAGWDAAANPSNPALKGSVMWIADAVGLISFTAVFVAFHFGG